MAPIRHLTAVACGSLLAALLAPGEAKALTFYKYTFTPDPGAPQFGWLLDTTQTNPQPSAGSDPSIGENGAGVNGISLSGTLFWDGPGTVTLTGSLTIQQYAGTTAVGSPVTFDCATDICAATTNQEFVLEQGSVESAIVLAFTNPTVEASYSSDDNPFDISKVNKAGFRGADQNNLNNNIEYFMAAGDQIGGGGTINVQEIPGPLSPLALPPLLLGLKTARKRYSKLS